MTPTREAMAEIADRLQADGQVRLAQRVREWSKDLAYVATERDDWRRRAIEAEDTVRRLRASLEKCERPFGLYNDGHPGGPYSN